MAFPTTPQPHTITLESNQPGFMDLTNSGKRQVRLAGGHLWSVAARFRPMTIAQFAPIFAFAMKQQGQYGSFEFVDPHLATPRGVVTGTPLVKGASQSGNTLVIDGCTPNITAWAKALDIFRPYGSAKVYRLTENANTNASGETTLTFEPELIASPADNAAVSFTNVPFTVMFNGPVQRYVASASGNLYIFEVNLIEALS